MTTPAAPHDWTEAKDDRLRELWTAGETVRAIAAELGVTYHQTWKRRQFLGLPDRAKSHHGGTAGNYWSLLKRKDNEFAAAMAGREFASVKVTDDKRRMPSRETQTGRGASSMALNA